MQAGSTVNESRRMIRLDPVCDGIGVGAVDGGANLFLVARG